MHARLAVILLIAASVGACSKPSAELYIPFIIEFAGEDINCHAQSDVWLTDLRFYVSEIHLIDKDGRKNTLALHEDEIWQHDNVALLDFEHGGSECVNGTGGVNQVLRGSVASGDYTTLEFTLGVPFEANHLDPLLAAAPLDDAAMHWHWRGGYKFLRAGVRTASDHFWIHLGSTGCQGTLQNITACNAPNRVVVRLEDFVPNRDLIVVDLAQLATPGQMNDGIPTNCSSGPAETSCIDAFRSLGLDHASGDANGVQQVFFSRPLP
jgi:uncharacterized repeat protein (TIGR04052 family)